MSEALFFPSTPSEHDLAQLYRLQVRELEDFALYMATPKGQITTCNRGVEKILGYTEEEWPGQHASIIFTLEDRAAGVVESEMQTAAEQGRCVDVRWHLRKDGIRVYMTGVLRGLRDEGGKLIGSSKVSSTIRPVSRFRMRSRNPIRICSILRLLPAMICRSRYVRCQGLRNYLNDAMAGNWMRMLKKSLIPS